VTIRVLIADDEALIRGGFRMILDAQDDIEVVGEAIDGRDAVAQFRLVRPDVVVMDVRMPTMDGIEATRAIIADPHLEGVRVIVLTTFEIDEYVFGALRAGASGFLLKDIDAPELQLAIRTVSEGNSLLAPAVTKRVIEEFTGRASPTPIKPERLDVLTERERHAVRLAARGLTNDEIGAEMIISPLTAKTHLNRAMAKLGARDRAQLVVIAFETGLANLRH
jgi:DNA-binding NarL/FixJ family response regulator